MLPLRELVYPDVQVYAITVLPRSTNNEYEDVAIEMAGIFLYSVGVLPRGINEEYEYLAPEIASMSLCTGC